MNEFEYRITEQVYNWIVVGTKKVEVRLYNEKSSKIKVNDIIEIQFGERTVKAEVLEVNEVVRKEQAGMMYRIIE